MLLPLGSCIPSRGGASIFLNLLELAMPLSLDKLDIYCKQCNFTEISAQ